MYVIKLLDCSNNVCCKGFSCAANLREVADDVEAKGVIFCHDVEEEWIRVVVEGLVVEKQLGQ